MMQSSYGKTQNVLLVSLFLIALFAVAGVWIFWPRPTGHGPEPENGAPDSLALSTQEARQLIALKNRGISQLENEKYVESIECFANIVRQIPNEPLGTRNQTIAQLLWFTTSGVSAKSGAEEYTAALKRIATTAEHLLKTDGGSAVSHLLAAKVAQLAGNTPRAVKELAKATDIAPEEPAFWFELYRAGHLSNDETIKLKAREALKRTYELRPANFSCLKDWLLVQALAKDAMIAETLQNTRKVFQPFAKTNQRFQQYDLLSLIDKASTALCNPQLEDAAKWTTVEISVRRIGNLLISDNATRNDLRRIERHLLEYIIHDFSSDFYHSAKLPEPELPPAIPVKMEQLPSESQLPALENVRAAHLADFDLDGRVDVVLAIDNKIEVYGRGKVGDHWQLVTSLELPSDLHGFQLADLDRDYRENLKQHPSTIDKSSLQTAADVRTTDVDIVVYGPDGVFVLENRLDAKTGTRSLKVVVQDSEFQKLRNSLAVALVDVDHEGDLDVVISTTDGISVWSNRGNMTFLNISDRSALPPTNLKATVLLPVDWNRDLGVDLLLSGPRMATVGNLKNQLHGRFRWREFDLKFDKLGSARSLVLLDVDGNASWDLLACGHNGISLTQTLPPTTGVVSLFKSRVISESSFNGLATWDYDNDGYLDFVAWNTDGVEIYRGGPGGQFKPVPQLFDQQPVNVTSCDIDDLDGDGDIDLLVVQANRLVWYQNDGGSQNHWINVVLRADENPEQFPNLRTNMHGIGSLLELKSDTIYQPRVVTNSTMHFGLGKNQKADVVRVLWTNGIASNIVAPKSNVIISEQQDLKGSCPYLYTWTGSQYEFLTDLLWAAPIGLQLSEGVLAPTREWEFLKIPGERLAETNGEYRLQITEELWETAYFDSVKILAVDHPADIQIFSNEKVGPADIAEFKIHTVRNPRLPIFARDQHGRDVLSTVTHQDEIYLKAFDQLLAQGLTTEHFLELHLGNFQEPKRIMLFLTGWTHPTDTSINVSLSQNPDVVAPRPPSIWVPDGQGRWKQTIPYMGFPGGKTKTIAVDLSNAFLTDDYRLRIVTTMEVYWDAVFFSVDENPAEYRVTTMPLQSANLHFRGFSRAIRHPQHGPERYNYNFVTTAPKWPPIHGQFTRYGDVTELIQESDDLLAVLGAGDEMTLRFQAAPSAPPEGWTRDFLIHNVGWDKDADLNTIYGQTVEPLPFHAMSGYPDTNGQTFPNTLRHRDYRRSYQTRMQNHVRFWRHIRDFSR